MNGCAARWRRERPSGTSRPSSSPRRPEQAIADALATFPADEIVIATDPPARAHWLARDLVERTADRYSLPVTPIEVDEPRPPVPLGAAAPRSDARPRHPARPTSAAAG